MHYFATLQHQIGILIILSLIGFLIGKINYMPSDTRSYLSKFVIKVTLPALIVSSVANTALTKKNLSEGIAIMAGTLAFLIISYLIANLVGKCLKLPPERSMVFNISSVFGHTTHLGLPLLFAIYGEQIVKYVVFFIVTQDLTFWIAGIYLLSNHIKKEQKREFQWKANLKKLINPNTAAYTIGIILAVFHVNSIILMVPAAGSLYGLTMDALSALGGTSIYIVMIFIGLLLAETETDSFLKSIKTSRDIFAVTILKLIVMPAAAMALFYLFKDQTGRLGYYILVLQFSMPCGSMVPAFVMEYAQDYKFASKNLFLTTLLSLITIPIFFYFLSKII